MSLKSSDIDMMETDGQYQLSIGNHCVTGYNYKSPDACYKAYIVKLIKSINSGRDALDKVPTGF